MSIDPFRLCREILQGAATKKKDEPTNNLFQFFLLASKIYYQRLVSLHSTPQNKGNTLNQPNGWYLNPPVDPFQTAREKRGKREPTPFFKVTSNASWSWRTPGAEQRHPPFSCSRTRKTSSPHKGLPWATHAPGQGSQMAARKKVWKCP